MCRRVIVDTSVWMYIVEKRLDPIEVLFSTYPPVCQVIIPDVVEKELELLARESASRRGKNAAVALLLIKEMGVRNSSIITHISIGEIYSDVDTVIINTAKQGGYVLATADRRMKKLAEQKGVEVMFLRGAKGRLI
ncbi:MAG: PIN domain-containing protein [Infirmifilum sp.]